jgi:uncharacterized protein (DUF1330 family)
MLAVYTFDMSAYVIVDIDIHDPALYEEYKKYTPGSIAEFGGKFLVRGGEAHTLEGEWKPSRIVVLEFPSVEKAKEWWDSPTYRKARDIRQRAAKTDMIIVQGV